MKMSRLMQFLALSTASLLAYDNLVSNPSFEQEKDGKPLGWKYICHNAKLKQPVFTLVNGGTNGVKAVSIESTDDKTSVGDYVALLHNIDMKLLAAYEPRRRMMLSFDFNPDAPGTKIRAYVEGSCNGKGFNSIGKTDSNYVGWKHYELVFQLPDDKPNSMYVVLQLLTRGKVIFDNVCIADAPANVKKEESAEDKMNKLPHIDMRFLNMPPRNTFVLGEDPLELKMFAHIGIDKYPEVLAEVTDEADGKVVARRRLTPYANAISETWKLPNLAPGVYKVTCKATIRFMEVAETMLFRVATKEEYGKYRVRFNRDKIMLLDGKPVFPIIVCPPFTKDKALKAYQEAGFNMITAHFGLDPAIVDKAAKYDLTVVNWINYADRAGRPFEKLEAEVKAYAASVKDKPNFIGWMNDEDAWRNISIEDEKKCYDLFFKASPGHIMWTNQAPRGSVPYLRRFIRYSDISGADVYPVPKSSGHNNKPRRNIACMGDYTDDFIEAGEDSIPVWMILQAWSWGGKKGTAAAPFPTYHELRFMFYNCITHGATGISWFDNNTLDPMNPVLPFVSHINHEFLSVVDFITTGFRSSDFSLGTDVSGIRIMERAIGGDRLLIICNENEEKAKAIVNCAKQYCLFDTLDGKETAPAAILEMDMEPFDVRVLCTKKVSYTYPTEFEPMEEDIVMPLREAVEKNVSCKTTMRAQWVWDETLVDSRDASECIGVGRFTLNAAPKSSWFFLGADNEAVFFINGKKVGKADGWSGKAYDITQFLMAGENTINVNLVNYSGPGGFVYEGEVTTENGVQTILSSGDIKFLDKDGKPTHKAKELGVPPCEPWKHCGYVAK